MQGHILVIDDAVELTDFLTMVLEAEGYRVTVCNTLTAALMFLGVTRFDLIVTDSFSPSSQHALTATGAVLRAVGSTPVVLCTGHHLEADEVRAAGFAELIRKPFDLDHFDACLRAVMSSCGHQEQREPSYRTSAAHQHDAAHERGAYVRQL